MKLRERLYAARMHARYERSLNRADRSDYDAYKHVALRCAECGARPDDRREHPRNHEWQAREITRWDPAVAAFVPIAEHSDPKVRAWL